MDLTRNTIITRLEKAVAAQETKKKDRLSPKEVAEALNRPNIEGPNELCEALIGEGILFRHSNTRFVPRASFFSGGKVLIRPTEEEIERGILIPGHRFLPLYDRMVLPKEIKLRVKNGTGKSGTRRGKKLKRTPVSMNISGLRIYYSLFGVQNYLSLLASESEQNAKVMGAGNTPENSLVSVSAFDMRSIYEELSFRPGDHLVARLEDWKKGRFEIYRLEEGETDGGFGRLEEGTGKTERESSEAREGQEKQERRTAKSEQKVANWIAALDKGFETLFSEVPWPLSPEEELARAFFHAGKEVVDEPALHVGGYLEESSLVGIVFIDGESYLWDVRTEVAPEARDKAGMHERGLSASRFEELCLRYGITIPMPYAEACVRRYLEENRWTFSHLLHDVFAGVDVGMLDDESLFRLTDSLETYMEGFSSSEISADKNYRYIRDQYILLYREIMRWLLSQEEYYGSLEAADKELILELIHTAMKAVDVLHLLNSRQSLKQESGQEESLEGLSEMYEELSGIFRRSAARIYEELKDGERSVRREERLKSSSAVEYVVMDVELVGLDPPVFRRLRVPETMSLRDVHEVLQVSLEWEDYHLHTFEVAGAEYTDLEFWETESADEPEPNDEELLEVADLPDLCEEFFYVYDFGDNWRHRVTLREVVPAAEVPDEERETVVCLEGQGAGPPEDCGGIGGYVELVEALETPWEQRDDEQEQQVLWAGDWRPDDFSLEELNLRLKRL